MGSVYWGLDVITLHHGDCLDHLRTLADNSVDAVVTDPPYGLSAPPDIAVVLAAWMAGERYEHKGGGFMSAAWDSFVPGPQVWREVFRVLKPGGHAVVFAGTRTVDLMGISARLAGFEVRDVIHWCYWCLDEETEILTDKGWARYTDAIVGSRALCFDTTDNSYRWGTIENKPVFDFQGDAFRVVGDRTDQLVTGGHRCVIERGGGYGFAFARDLARQPAARVPVVEGLRELLRGLPLSDEGAGGSESVLLRTVRGESAANEGARAQVGDVAHADVLRVRRGVREAEGVGRRDVLQAVQRQGQGAGAGGPSEPRQGGNVFRGNREALREDEGREQSRMEGRRGGAEQARPSGGVGEVPARVRQHGQDERLRIGASAGGCAGHRSAPDTSGGRTPHGPRPVEQCPGESGAVCVQPRPQVVRGEGHTVSDVVRVEPVAYTGKVWCVTVPTGAFVARRRGRVFVTGNSGFPKSLDISKAIDALHGAEREVVAPSPWNARKPNGSAGVASVGLNASPGAPDITAPATEDAKRWAGHGTAVKPAIEPALLLRKPISETSIARNVLKWGTGSLNIDACRFAPGDPMWPGPDDGPPLQWEHGRSMGYHGAADGGPCAAGVNNAGRFPANLVHVPKASRAERELGCEGLPTRTGAEATGSKEGQARLDSPRTGAGRSADAIRNFHPTVKPLGLMRWLVRLVTPPSGVVLDPFTGSGTTGMAAVGQGFSFIGCELLAEHVQIARARIEYAATGQTVDCDLADSRTPPTQPSMF